MATKTRIANKSSMFSQVMLVVIVLQLSLPSQLSEGFGISEQTKSCVNSLNKIESLQQFEEEFVPEFLKLAESSDKKDLIKCLNSHSEEPLDDVRDLKLAIVMGKEEDVCNYNYARMVLARYHDTKLKNDANHSLRTLFDFYVKKVLAKCKQVSEDKLASIQAENRYISVVKIILNVVTKTRAMFLGNNSGGYTAKEALYELSTQANNNNNNNRPLVETLIFAEEIVADIKNKAFTLNLPYREESLDVFFEIQSACNQLLAYQEHLLYGIAEMAKRGYTVATGQLINDDDVDHQARFQLTESLSGFAAAQMCQLVKLLEIKVHKSGRDIKLVFGRLNRDQSNNDDDDASMIQEFEFDSSLARSVTSEELGDNIRSSPCFAPNAFIKIFAPTKCSNEMNVDRAKALRAIKRGLFSQNFLNRFGEYLQKALPSGGYSDNEEPSLEQNGGLRRDW